MALPRAILFDLDDTILSAFGQAEGQWQRVIADFAERLVPHPPDDVIAAIQAYSKYLWADEARHKHWRATRLAEHGATSSRTPLPS